MTFDEWFDREGYDEQHRFGFGLAWNAGMDSAAGHDRKPLPRDPKNQHAIEVPGFGWVAVKAVRAIERAHGIG